MKKTRQIILSFFLVVQILIMNNIKALSGGEDKLIKDENYTISKKWIIFPAITIPILIYSICFERVQNINVNSWEEVAKIWNDIYNSYRNKNSAEAYETLAEMHKCLSYSSSQDSTSQLESAKTNYERAAQEYNKLIKKNDDINSAKKAEMIARSAECGACLDENKWNEALEEWERVTLTKPSYAAYARVKMEECRLRSKNSDVDTVCNLLEELKKDKELEKSFSPVCYRAYISLIDANICSYRYFKKEINWEATSNMWKNASNNDLKVIQNLGSYGTSWYMAFAAEALMKSKDKNHCYYL